MKDISQYFPVLAGSPPAFVLAAGLYKSIAFALGITEISLLSLIPAALAGCGMVGMISTEMMTYKVTARAFARQEWGAFWISAFGVALISGFVLFAVYVGADTKALATSTVTMLVGYVIIGVTTYMDTHRTVKKENAEEVERQTANQIALLKAQAEAAERLAKAEAEKLDKERLLQNSRNRAGASSGQSQSVRPVRSDTRTSGLDAKKVKALAEWLKAHPEAKSLRDVAESGIIGKSQAGPYIKAAQELNKAVQS